MSASDGSPTSSPPAPPADSAPPPDDSSKKSPPPPDNSSGKSTPPPVDSSTPPSPPSDSSSPPPEASPPPPNSKLQPPPSPPPAADSPTENSNNSPPPPTPTTTSPSPPTSAKSPSPPPPADKETPPAPPDQSNSSPSADKETPPAPPNQSNSSPSPDKETPPAPPKQSNNSPPSPDVQSPPPSSSSTNPKNPPSDTPPSPQKQPTNSPPAPPTQTTNSPPAPPSDATQSPPVQPLGPANSSPTLPNAPPSPFNSAPQIPNRASGGTTGSPSLTVPSKETPPTNNNNNGNGYHGETMAGMALAGFAIMALIAIVFLVRRKKKKNLNNYGHSQYLPHSDFAVKPDGFLYGQDPGIGYSGPAGSMYNSQQQSSTGNSYVSQRGHHQQSSGTFDSPILGTGQTHFSYEELADITQGFSRQNILGEGGFGCVYKGTLRDGKLVAVKQLKAGSGQGDREFKAEVEIISRVHHRHLVSLVGYCISDQHRLLIYEYVSNQTLEHHLHGKGMPVLDWSRRLRIAIGSAKGLAYLHEDCHPKIIHRDIKSANILLDDVYEAQVADFGLARLNDTSQTHVSTRVMGTFGYLAPEYASSGKLTDRSDVFSFGVVLLELVTGRKPVDQNQPLGEESLVEWARPILHKAIETGDISELIDKRLEYQYVEHEVFRMIETAAACVRHSGPKRPRMVQVVRALDSDGDSGDINNGIKVGQSTAYDSGQYNQDIMKFRKMAFGSDEESGLYSGDYSVKSSSDFSGNESETRPFNSRQY